MKSKDSLPVKIIFCLVIAAIICFCCQQVYSFEYMTQSRYELSLRGCQRIKRDVKRVSCERRKIAELNNSRGVEYK